MEINLNKEDSQNTIMSDDTKKMRRYYTNSGRHIVEVKNDHENPKEYNTRSINIRRYWRN